MSGVSGRDALGRFALPLLCLGVAILSWGLWNASIPMGDEGVHILQAIKLQESGGYSSNLYYTSYKLLLDLVSGDPVVAHLVMRFAAALFSTVGLYFVLTAFRMVSPVAAMLACMAWASSSLVMPYTQQANVNLFALGLVMPGLAILLRHPTVSGLLAFLLGCLWAAMTRPEYYASLLAVGLCGVTMILFSARSSPTTSRKGVAIILAALIAGSTWILIKSPAPGGGVDEYLLQGLGQCYASYYVKRHPEAHFDPMTEYEPLLNRTFGNPKGFFEAVSNNPSEAFRYFAVNGAHNIIKVPGRLLGSGSPVRFGITLLLLVAGTIIGLTHSKSDRKNPSHTATSNMWEKLSFTHLQVLALVGLASASFAAIILLIPDERYWISWVPLIYLWLAWSIDQVLEIRPLKAHATVVVIALAAVLCAPKYAWRRSNQEIIYQVREAVKKGPDKPIVAGNSATGWAIALFGNGATVVNDASPWELRKGRYHVFVSSGLDRTSRWLEDLPFLKIFTANPESYGYRNISHVDGTKSDIYVRLASPPR